MNLHVEGGDLRMGGEAIMEGGEWTPDETMSIFQIYLQFYQKIYSLPKIMIVRQNFLKMMPDAIFPTNF